MSGNSDLRWDNQFGIILLPIGYHKSGPDPLMYLKRAKLMIDRKKQSLEAHFSYIIGYYKMYYVGLKVNWDQSKITFFGKEEHNNLIFQSLLIVLFIYFLLCNVVGWLVEL